ncbi:Uncharacterized protein NEOC65_000450 [Neochlamydia sp. AcF65]|uniref:lipase family protein n=1 Tax=Neochlamydia sp. AcF65 TaxID=2795735 RepID=UPI001BC93755|nr:hypothetical protein [Neochlamydia sp. AcF65]MBS4165393.1 Uncharacterized protein [Neochlamydia sp. AcF65]
MLNLFSWTQFSETYLKCELKSSVLDKKTLSKSLDVYLKAELKVELSPSAAKILKRYAFHKAGIKSGQQKNLSSILACQVLENYNELLGKIRFEFESLGFVKPAKPVISKTMTWLTIFSSSIADKHWEPKVKANLQKLFDQAYKINLINKVVFKKDPHIELDKLISLELVGKQLAYFNPKEGERFQIPCEGRMIEYEASKIPLWMGMCAYGFKPVDENEKAPPILAFSGTRIGLSRRGFLATLAADFDLRGVGYIAYASGKRNITQWLEQNKNALVTGHSLGGALARYTAIDNPSLVHGAFSFNAPGISATYGKKWDQLKTELPQHRPHMYNFHHSEDKVPTFGQCYIGKNYQVICSVEKTVNQRFTAQYTIHNKMLFCRKIAILCKATPKPSLSLKMQRFVGIIPFIFFISLLFINRGLFGLYDSRPYASVFGPLRWVWRQLITNQLAIEQLDIEYSQPQRSAIAA